MKNFKLKYVALILTVASFTSCSKDYAIEEADKTAIENSDAFVFEDNINNYVIDGEMTYDRKQIASSAKKAWNVHYDYPHNKVVISTTPEEFETDKKSDLEFKKNFEKNDTKENGESIPINSFSRIPANTPDHSEGISFLYERTKASEAFHIVFKLFSSPTFTTQSVGIRSYPTIADPLIGSIFTINGIQMTYSCWGYR
jgi:hypothetical protein